VSLQNLLAKLKVEKNSFRIFLVNKLRQVLVVISIGDVPGYDCNFWRLLLFLEGKAMALLFYFLLRKNQCILNDKTAGR
jgi:hypothetical protein